MAVLVPPGYGIASFIFSVAGKSDEMVTTLGYSVPDPVPVDYGAAAILSAWSSNGRPFSAPWINEGYTFRGVRVSAGGITGAFSAQALINIAGTLSGNPLPPNCCVLVRKNTARGGRKGRGRMYLPPCMWGESGVEANGANPPSLVTGLDGRLELARADMIALEVTPVLFHEDGTSADAITSFSTQSMIATQRRRLR